MPGGYQKFGSQRAHFLPLAAGFFNLRMKLSGRSGSVNNVVEKIVRKKPDFRSYESCDGSSDGSLAGFLRAKIRAPMMLIS